MPGHHSHKRAAAPHRPHLFVLDGVPDGVGLSLSAAKCSSLVHIVLTPERGRVMAIKRGEPLPYTIENDVLHEMLRHDLAAIIRSVEPDWLTRGYGDADLRNKIREWADFMKWAGDDRA